MRPHLSRWRLFVFSFALLTTSAATSAFAQHDHHTTHAAPLAASAASPMPAPSTVRMASRLQEITAGLDLTKSPFDYVERADRLGTEFAAAKTTEARLKVAIEYAHALLRSGQTERAIGEYESFEQLWNATQKPMWSELLTQVNTSTAMSYLRLGELENCLHNHNADSCLLPIRGGGVHKFERGSRGAVQLFTQQLERFPGDLRARWLLNIAYMTLGEYPDGVPPRWLIDPKHFESDYDIKRFHDVAGALGLDVDDLAGGVVMEDLDRDGFLDLMCSAQGTRSQLRYFRNNGDGSFTQLTEQAGVTGLTGGLNLTHGDYNNDGYPDVLVLRGGWLAEFGRYPDSLLRNNGDGTFTDVTEEAGMLSFHPNQTATWFDYNGDGWIDIYVGNESERKELHPCELYRNNGDGTFTEVAAESGVAFVGYVKAVISADFNNDGRPDLYVSRRDGANVLYRNDGPAGDDRSPRGAWKFTDIAKTAGVTEPFRSFSAWAFDFDNDGWMDLACTGYYIQDSGDIAADYLGLPHAGERMRLYRNQRDGTFADVTKEMGLFKLLLTMGCNFGDLDNDGWLDFYAATGDPEFTTLVPNRMFRNDRGRRFQDVTTSGGFGQLQKGHGIAFGDIDHDGDQDIYAVIGGAITVDNYRNQLFKNPGHGNHWLKLELEGVKSNRSAFGARIKVVVKTESGEREIHRVVGTGGSFGSAPLRQEIGLAQATAILRAEIFWPATGITQVLPHLEINHAYKVREGVPTATAVALRTFQLPDPSTAPHAHHHAHHAAP